MRALLVTLLVLIAVLSLRTSTITNAAAAPVVNAPAPTISHGQDAADVNDDDTVAVQLIVLGIVFGTVFVLGSAAYVLRVKLGRTAYTPPTDTGHH